MPYIEKKLRDQLKTRKPSFCGERSYLMCDIINNYLNAHGRSYSVFDNVMQALEELTRFDLYEGNMPSSLLAQRMFIDVFNSDKKLVKESLGTIRFVEIELSRRLIIPYEDVKLSLNGDVFTSEPEKV